MIGNIWNQHESTNSIFSKNCKWIKSTVIIIRAFKQYSSSTFGYKRCCERFASPTLQLNLGALTKSFACSVLGTDSSCSLIWGVWVIIIRMHFLKKCFMRLAVEQSFTLIVLKYTPLIIIFYHVILPNNYMKRNN